MKHFLLVLVSLIILSGGCAGPVDEQKETDKTIHIVYTDWAESVALTYLSDVLLSEYLGYDVVTRLAGVDTVFRDVAAGEADLFVDAWMPETHGAFLERYEGQFEDLGPNYHMARTGLVVPDYMPVKTIPELHTFYTGPIAGIDTSAGIMRFTLEALDTYELDNELLVLSDPEMAEKLEHAIRRREHMVVTGWEPHWLMYRYDLRFLEDPLEIYMDREEIHTIGRIGFSEDHPRAAVLFERMVLRQRHMNSLLYEVQRHQDPLAGVYEWISNNEVVVNQWVRRLMPEREKIM